MYWRLRIDVMKNDSVVIFPDDFRWDLSCDNFFENGHDIYGLGTSNTEVGVNLRNLALIQMRKL